MSVSFSYLYIVALRVLFKLLTTSFFYEMTKCIEIDCYLIRRQLQHNNLTLLFDFFFTDCGFDYQVTPAFVFSVFG